MTAELFESIRLGAQTASNRILFGPHVTNLGTARSVSGRHAAYYERRARGGCAVIVTEVASVHDSDWPYERAPLATASAQGWSQVVDACGPHRAIVLAGLGHAGMQGSTAWSQDVLWAPSLVPSVMSREQPLVVGEHEIAELVGGFGAAARTAVEAGCHGVELNAGQHSLLRQFCSGLTNLRADRFGQDRSCLLREVIAAVRGAIGDAVIGLRFSVDELAPWAGITPPDAVELLAGVADDVDYVCLVRGSIYTEAATQPDCHVEQAFNETSTALVTADLRERGISALVCAQGSIVDVEVAERLVQSGACDLVEMTRAQIADPDLCNKTARGDAARVRPCLLCNQHCLVRDPRNPLVSCCVNPAAGHERDESHLDVDVVPAAEPGSLPEAFVIGGGIAGMEAARLLARRGHTTTLIEQRDTLGGMLRTAARLPGRARLAALCDWLEREAAAEGVRLEMGRCLDPAAIPPASTVVVATGGTDAVVVWRDGSDGTVALTDASAVADGHELHGAVVVLDPIGGPVGIAVAELAALRGVAVSLVTPDVVAGSQLSATGDLVDANARLASSGVRVVTHARPVAISAGSVVLEDCFTGETTSVPASVCVDAGHRLPGGDTWPDAAVVGDALAPRGILMAMLEARRAAIAAAVSR